MRTTEHPNCRKKHVCKLIKRATSAEIIIRTQKKIVASKYKQMLFQTIEVKWQQNEERKEETNKVKMYIINKHEKEEIA